MTPRAPPRPLHFEKTSRASASRFAESVASHFTMLAARPMLSDHSSPPACFTSQRYASAAAATSPASRSSEASRRAMAIGCIIIFWQSKGTVRAARTAASAPARSPRSRRMATRSSTSSSLAALACGGGGGASALAASSKQAFAAILSARRSTRSRSMAPAAAGYFASNKAAAAHHLRCNVVGLSLNSLDATPLCKANSLRRTRQKKSSRARDSSVGRFVEAICQHSVASSSIPR
mmetsp:Transcript_7114/g.23126  ORF Transcript_7114/g.23126 Transcript_7114/m.23126 type:complete len:235 (+) Transcript_7114:1359-2063(+)